MSSSNSYVHVALHGSPGVFLLPVLVFLVSVSLRGFVRVDIYWPRAHLFLALSHSHRDGGEAFSLEC